METRLIYFKTKSKEVVPSQATEGSAGIDLPLAEPVFLFPGESGMFTTGLFVELPKDCAMLILPRSGIAKTYPNYIANAPGLIDPDYRGEIKLTIKNNGDQIMHYPSGSRIAQGVLVPIIPSIIIAGMFELSETERGTGGFGSTGV